MIDGTGFLLVCVLSDIECGLNHREHVSDARGIPVPVGRVRLAGLRYCSFDTLTC